MGKKQRAITVEDLTVGYNNSVVLNNVNLEIEAHEIMGITGPNGAGKTTLFRSLLGLISPLKGRIIFHYGAKYPTIGYVPQHNQHDSAYPLTVFEVAAMGYAATIKPWNILSRRQKRYIMDMLDALGLGSLYKKSFSELSGGQRQRLLLARALLIKPDILFLDEPFSGIDYNSTEMIAEQLKRLNEENKMTILLIHHNPLLVEKLAHRILGVDQGKVILLKDNKTKKPDSNIN